MSEVSICWGYITQIFEFDWQFILYGLFKLRGQIPANVQSNPDRASPSVSSHEGLWTEIPYCTVPLFITTHYTATNCGEKRVALYRGLSVCSEVRGNETKAKEIETVFRIRANFLLTKQNFSGIYDRAVHRGWQDVKIHYAMLINLTVERLRNWILEV